jgi:D-amino-acid dehydrogenase
MRHIAVIGAGITGVTTAYALVDLGYKVTVLDRHRYPAMETSFANGGQLSASNAEVWNQRSTIMKGLKWMLRKDAPLLMNPLPSFHKYSWMAEFLRQIPSYRNNTVATVRMAIAARDRLFHWAEREQIDFNHESRGILHIYTQAKGFDHAVKVNELLREGGLERHAVTPEEIKTIEPALTGTYYGGFFTESDSTGDIHKYTRGLASACERQGVIFQQDASVTAITSDKAGAKITWIGSEEEPQPQTLEADAVVVCAGVGSRAIAAMLGDRVNIYPVKGYSITVALEDAASQKAAPWVSLLDDEAKIVSSRLGADRLRVAGTAEINGENRDIRDDRIQPLVDWTRHHFAAVGTDKVIPWAGLRPMLPGMLPRVGLGKLPGVYYNTGHGHLGWTLAAATAELVAATIAVRQPPK